MRVGEGARKELICKAMRKEPLRTLSLMIFKDNYLAEWGKGDYD